MSKPSKPPRRFKVGEQEYRVVGVEGYWRDDRYIELHAIEAICAHRGCNRVFRAAATKTAINKRAVNRRCSWHKAPGSPVGDQRPKAKKRVRKRPARPGGRSAQRVPPQAPKPPAAPSYLD
jgi:nitrite reductase/ring-hydroxylating ferredoxin subunit